MNTLQKTLYAYTIKILLIALLGLAISACQTAKTTASTPQIPDSDTGPIQDATSASYKIDINTLASLLPATFEQMHWAKLATRTYISSLRATAITPDDRVIDIRAQQTKKSNINLQIKIGYFGNQVTEKQFHKTLAANIKKHLKSISD